MKFQRTHQHNSTRQPIAAAVGLELACFFQALHGKPLRTCPKHHRIKFLLAD